MNLSQGKQQETRSKNEYPSFTLLFYRSIKPRAKKLLPGRDRESKTPFPGNSFPDGYPAVSCPEVRPGAKIPFSRFGISLAEQVLASKDVFPRSSNGFPEGAKFWESLLPFIGMPAF
ncbi:hypothetical protein NPIL_458341 [Nephila pilipes]|uniref:Uncharacterized protein n=1 Tax=Nephila pilipes TaxID=299642 RepID=A0A8X6UKP4_NEPPI|nr:hypothetical protein NPIL_458341 [Nephila pilipes]